MTAEEHNKTLATLYFIYSGIHGLTLIGLLLLVLVVKFATPALRLVSTRWRFGMRWHSVICFLLWFVCTAGRLRLSQTRALG
jgi:hypothetical protein